MANKKITDLDAKISTAQDDLLLLVDSEDSSIEKKLKLSSINKLGGQLTLGRPTVSDDDTVAILNFDRIDDLNQTTYSKVQSIVTDADAGYATTKITARDENGEAELNIVGGATSHFHITDPIRIGGDTTANELDDFEEGTWTPIINHLGGSTQDPAVDEISGRYIKVGNVVTIFASWKATATGSSVSNASKIVASSMPFTPANATNVTSGINTSMIQCRGNAIGSDVGNGVFIGTITSTGISFRKSTSPSTFLSMSAILAANALGYFQGQYYTTS